MKHLLVVLIALASWLTAAIADDLALVTPYETTLRLTKLQQRESVAEFRGTAKVMGKLVAQWVPAIDEDKPNHQQFRLYVTPATAVRLPHFQGYPVQKIDITNGLAALRMVAPAGTYSAFAQKRTLLVEAEGTFELRDFIVGVECDAQWARSFVTRAEAPSLLAAAGNPVRFGC